MNPKSKKLSPENVIPDKEKPGYQHVVHTFEPVYDENSEILILGTFPSVKSRENNFYYGHPQNRFWKLIAGLTKESVAGDDRGKEGSAFETSHCHMGCGAEL